MEDGFSTKEAIDVKKGRKEKGIHLQRMERMEEEQMWKKLLVFDVITQSIGSHIFY